MSAYTESDGNVVDTIRRKKSDYPSMLSREKMERPELGSDYYRNYPAEPAIDVLQKILDDYLNLEWVPDGNGYFMDPYGTGVRSASCT